MDIAIPLEPRITVRFLGASDTASRFFEAEYGSMRIADIGDEPDIVVRFVEEMPEPRSWDALGRRVAVADDSLVVTEGDAQARIQAVDGGRLLVEVQQTMPIDSVRRRVVIPSIALLALRRDAVVIHGSATGGANTNVLLLGEAGVGKTGLLTDLIAHGQTYIADDQLLLTADSRLIALQGLLELRLDMIAARPDIAKLAQSTGWKQTRALRSALRSLRALTTRVPMRTTQRASAVLGRMEDALSAHCFFLDPRDVFETREDYRSNLPIRVFLLTRGLPETAEPATQDIVEQWVFDAVTAAHEPLFELLRAAARVSPYWKRILEEVGVTQQEVVAAASQRISAVRLRVGPDTSGAKTAREIAALAAEPTG